MLKFFIGNVRKSYTMFFTICCQHKGDNEINYIFPIETLGLNVVPLYTYCILYHYNNKIGKENVF